MVDRMRRGQEIVVHGDGTSLWTLTHSRRLRQGLSSACSATRRRSATASTSPPTKSFTWNQIHEILAAAAGTTARIVHVPSDAILAADERWGRSLLGDKAHSVIFDNTKLRSLVPDFTATTPFFRGAREIVDWYDADPARQRLDERVDALIAGRVIRPSRCRIPSARGR